MKTTSPADATLRFTFSVGALIRGRVVSEIKKAAFEYGIEISIEEDRFFFDSNYRMKASGPASKLIVFEKNLTKYFEQLSREED